MIDATTTEPVLMIGYLETSISKFSNRELRAGHNGYTRGLEEYEHHLAYAKEDLERYQERFSDNRPDCYDEIVAKLQDHADRMQTERDRFAQGLTDIETEIAVRGLSLLHDW